MSGFFLEPGLKPFGPAIDGVKIEIKLPAFSGKLFRFEAGQLPLDIIPMAAVYRR